MTTTDKIEKKVVLRASHEKVWKAISDAKQFGSWFGLEVDGPFTAGATLTARIVPTTMDPETAKKQEQYRGKAFELAIDRVEPMQLFAFRWHPFAVDKSVDASEPMTLVEFRLTEVAGGTQLVITESGFDKLPPKRRAEAFAANEGGWQKQTELIAKYVER